MDQYAGREPGQPRRGGQYSVDLRGRRRRLGDGKRRVNRGRDVPDAFQLVGDRHLGTDRPRARLGCRQRGAAGYVGLDWGQVANLTATNNLSNTTISTGQTIQTVTGNVAGNVGGISSAVTVGSNQDKTGYSLASTGLDSISVSAPTGVASTFPGMLIQVWRRFFKASAKSAVELDDHDVRRRRHDGCHYTELHGRRRRDRDPVGFLMNIVTIVRSIFAPFGELFDVAPTVVGGNYVDPDAATLVVPTAPDLGLADVDYDGATFVFPASVDPLLATMDFASASLFVPITVDLGLADIDPDAATVVTT